MNDWLLALLESLQEILKEFSDKGIEVTLYLNSGISYECMALSIKNQKGVDLITARLSDKRTLIYLPVGIISHISITSPKASYGFVAKRLNTNKSLGDQLSE